MRRRSYSLPLAAVCCLVAASVAMGESQTVNGKGDIKKMTADNAQRAVKVKLSGLGKPCEARQMTITVFWGTKPAYQVQAGCYGGTTWASGLYYTADRRDGSLATKKVRCPGFRLRYDSGAKVWRAFVPRGCLSKAPNRIRVKSDGVNYAGSAIPGEAGPTRLLRRG